MQLTMVPIMVYIIPTWRSIGLVDLPLLIMVRRRLQMPYTSLEEELSPSPSPSLRIKFLDGHPLDPPWRLLMLVV
jgi:hypothetical protein